MTLGRATGCVTDGKSKNSQLPWSNPRIALIYTSTRPDGQRYRLYSIDPARAPQSVNLHCREGGGGWGGLSWSPGDRQLPQFKNMSQRRKLSLDLLDARNPGQKTLITPW
jgi:hypothetical protein